MDETIQEVFDTIQDLYSDGAERVTVWDIYVGMGFTDLEHTWRVIRNLEHEGYIKIGIFGTIFIINPLEDILKMIELQDGDLF